MWTEQCKCPDAGQWTAQLESVGRSPALSQEDKP